MFDFQCFFQAAPPKIWGQPWIHPYEITFSSPKINHHIPSYTIYHPLYDDIWWYLMVWYMKQNETMEQKGQTLLKKLVQSAYRAAYYGTALKIIPQNAWIPHRRLLDPSFDSWVTWAVSNPWLCKASAACDSRMWVTDWAIGSPVLNHVCLGHWIQKHSVQFPVETCRNHGRCWPQFTTIYGQAWSASARCSSLDVETPSPSLSSKFKQNSILVGGLSPCASSSHVISCLSI